jgi:thymidylate kinase
MNHIHPAIVAVSGPIGSGKTTITTLMSERLHWPRGAYGDTVRTMATRRGVSHDRCHLQRIGSELIAGGWDTFTRLVLSQATWMPGEALILDGLRHVDAVAALQRIAAPLPVIVIYLDIPAATGLARAHRRDRLPDDQVRQEGRHLVEQDLPEVRRRSGLVLPVTDTTPALLADGIISYLHFRHGRQPGDRCA